MTRTDKLLLLQLIQLRGLIILMHYIFLSSMEFIATIIIEGIYMMLLNSIGAFFRSLFSKRSFKDLWDDKPLLNGLIGVLVIGASIWLIISMV